MPAWTCSLTHKELQYTDHNPVIKPGVLIKLKKHVLIRSTVDNPPQPTPHVRPGLRFQTHGLYVKSGLLSLKVRNVAIDENT